MGALACAHAARALGLETVIGGLTWERRPVDPLPGPRRLDELEHSRRLNDAVAIAGPDTTGPGGFRFAESRVAALIAEDVLLVDPNPGPPAVGAGIGDAARQLGCDHVVLLDVGGDVLAHGDEPGLGSPLADAVLLAAADSIGLPTTGAVFGVGCDGELTPTEVHARLTEVSDAGGSRGALRLDAEAVEQLVRAVAEVPTEASAMALRCALGETGEATIRDGRRTVQLTSGGGEIFLFDPEVAMRTAARLAAAVRAARSLREANDILTRMGVRTELDYEVQVAQ